MTNPQKHTHPVSDTVFRAVYDSPASLPGHHKWVTSEEDVRQIEELLGMPSKTIGVPLWVSGDRKHCPNCDRQTNWLDIVSSALDQVHSREMIARVILGEQKFVNTEAPRAIADLKCFRCQTAIENLMSFKRLEIAIAGCDNGRSLTTRKLTPERAIASLPSYPLPRQVTLANY